MVDINKERITAWNSESLPIYEPGLDEIVRAARDGDVGGNKHTPHGVPDGLSAQGRNNDGHARRPNLFFSTDVEQAISEADLIFVCVNTPTKSNGIGKGAAADLGFVEAATRQIAKVARESKIVVEKSTVPCRTSQSMREIVRTFLGTSLHLSATLLINRIGSSKQMLSRVSISTCCQTPSFLLKGLQLGTCCTPTAS